MENNKTNTPNHKDTDATKQNQDFPNIPTSSEKPKDEDAINEQIKKTSALQNEGKTDNTEKNQ